MSNLKITQQDIADALNISRTTVSKVFNGKPVPEKVRDTVLKKALEMGYLDTQSGMPEMETEQNTTVQKCFQGFLLLICFQQATPPQASAPESNMSGGWQKLIKGMEAACGEYGYHLIVSILSDTDGNIGMLLEHYTMGNVDGIILTGDYEKINAFLQVNKRNLPVVLADVCDVKTFDCSNLDVVAFDILGSMRRLVRHLAARGCKRLAYVGRPGSKLSMNERRMGFLHGCMENGQESDMSFLDLEASDESIGDQLKKMIEPMEELPGAFVCECDEIAIELLKVLDTLGYRVPDDAYVTGFDCGDEAQALERGVTTTLLSREDLGFTAVEQLVARILKPQSPNLMIRQRVKIALQRTTSDSCLS